MRLKGHSNAFWLYQHENFMMKSKMSISRVGPLYRKEELEMAYLSYFVYNISPEKIPKSSIKIYLTHTLILFCRPTKAQTTTITLIQNEYIIIYKLFPTIIEKIMIFSEKIKKITTKTWRKTCHMISPSSYAPISLYYYYDCIYK